MAHIAERQIGYYSAFCCGMTITTLIDARQVQAALLEVRPTWFFGVPRIYEKVEVAMLEHVGDDATRAALDAAVERVRDGEPWVDDPLLAPLREATGLEHAGWAGISGAPCSREMAERFHAVGIPLSEAWGMSETVIGTGASPDRIRIGAAGWPYSGHRDPARRRRRDPAAQPVGHARLPEGARSAPREAFTDDGFIKTGDLARFDEDGYLWVVGRKKDIIINSAGKNMSPVNIEQAIRGTDAVIAQVVCFGDGRPYNVGLIVLDPAAAAVARRRGRAAGASSRAIRPSSPMSRASSRRATRGSRASSSSSATRSSRARGRPAATSSRSPASSSARTSTRSTPSSSTTST